MKKIMLCSVGLLLLVGCALPRELAEQDEVPLYLSAYDVPSLNKYTKPLKCRLNLVNCVPSAAVGVKTLSGKTVSEQTFQIRPIVQSEFESVIRENFSMVVGTEQPNIELKVETQKVLLTLDGSNFSFVFSAAVKVLNPHHVDKPYFSKIYTVSKRCKKRDRLFVPDCVYAGVQFVLAQFIEDLAKDESLLTRLSTLVK